MNPSTPAAVVVERAQFAGGGADVVEREREEQLLGIAFAVERQGSQLLVIEV